MKIKIIILILLSLINLVSQAQEARLAFDLEIPVMKMFSFNTETEVRYKEGSIANLRGFYSTNTFIYEVQKNVDIKLGFRYGTWEHNKDDREIETIDKIRTTVDICHKIPLKHSNFKLNYRLRYQNSKSFDKNKTNNSIRALIGMDYKIGKYFTPFLSHELEYDVTHNKLEKDCAKLGLKSKLNKKMKLTGYLMNNIEFISSGTGMQSNFILGLELSFNL